MISYTFDHVHLNAPDVPATVSFYERVFGLRSIRTFEANGITFAHLDLNGVRIVITSRIPQTGGRGNAIDHFALHVPNLREAIAELRDKGVEFLSDYAEVGVYATAFIRAPDGVVIEILSPSTV
jgi:catechol 2,3-dioxygenase-like lactoylglutathione lyase family enzyme